MSFARSIRSAPIPFDPDRGGEVAALYSDHGDGFRDLITGMAGSAPYLAGLAEKHSDWLDAAVAGAAEDAMAGLLQDVGALEGHALADGLRQAKGRAALLIALADLGGVWDLDEVTGALSDLADASVQRAITHLVAQAQGAGKLPQVDAPDGGMVALAMGKLGARELNYSSDIDLILLFDDSLYPADDYAEIRQQFIRIGRGLVKLIGEETAAGYVFRTDLRLRPDPSVTPVCIGMGAAESYYESQGRTWERAAFIRARPCAGDIAAGEEFLETLTPFVWRRHLDYAAVQDAHDMRLRIRDHKGLGGPLRLPGHNVKLGRGGIREIEFFIQTNQLICGGRDPSLRAPRTRPALEALVQSGWVPREMADELADAYVKHRTLEHRLQMLEDQQTHSYPSNERGRARIAAFCGAEDGAAFEKDLTGRFARVHELVEKFFAPDQPEAAPEDIWAAYPDPQAMRDRLDAWHKLPALRTERAQRLFRRVAPQIVKRLAAAAKPDQAMLAFEYFLRGLPAGVQVFALFEANPKILDLLLDICATAPRLADYLGRNAGVLDAVLDRSFFDPLPGSAALAKDLDAHLAEAETYEDVLDLARIWAREQGFRVGVLLLRGVSDPREAGQGYSSIAEAVITCLMPRVAEEFGRRHGAPPGRGWAVLGMGKLGSGEMTSGSDLDLIVIYDAEPDEASDGRKPLNAKMYYARLTQALVAALTAPTSKGTLYEVDMRLRPSGRQGPVAVSLKQFARYQREDAWTWEHLALTRARVIAGGAGVRDDLTEAVGAALAEPRDAEKVLADVRDMRARLAEGKPAKGAWEVKNGPGRMLDIELLLQTGKVLTPGLEGIVAPREMIAPLAEAGWLEEAQAKVLDDALGRMSAIQQVARLSLEGELTQERAGPGLSQLLARVSEVETPDEIAPCLDRLAEAAAEIISGRLEAP